MDSNDQSPAVRRALALAERPRTIPAPEVPPKRSFAIGDPQTTASRFFEVLEANDLLAPSGALDPRAALICAGDHFDFHPPPGMSVSEAGVEGERILGWLAAHSTSQVRILLGNHDVCRLMELMPLSDADFEEARDLAAQIKAERASRDSFWRRFPSVPQPELTTRDFSAYRSAQREQLIRLLLDGRCQLAQSILLQDGTSALMTHAGISARELGILDADPATPEAIAAALNEALHRAVDSVREAWMRGEHPPLDLSPLHLCGVQGEEGGGLLYHRPASVSPGDPWANQRARRYAPERLPKGLIQVAGHTQHKKCVQELTDTRQLEVPPGALRTLRALPEGAGFAYGPFDAQARGTVLHLIDGSMNSTAPGAYALLPLAGWTSIA